LVSLPSLSRVTGTQGWLGCGLPCSCVRVLVQIREYEQVIIEDRIEKEKTRKKLEQDDLELRSIVKVGHSGLEAAVEGGVPEGGVPAPAGVPQQVGEDVLRVHSAGKQGKEQACLLVWGGREQWKESSVQTLDPRSRLTQGEAAVQAGHF
jgi:hypothetical protein